MDTKQGIVAELADFHDGKGGMMAVRARLEGEDPVEWYLIYGPLPEVGDVVKVMVTINETPYIDTSVRWPA